MGGEKNIVRSLRTPHKPEVRAIDVIAVSLDEFVRVTNLRVCDFGADVVLVKLPRLPMVLVQNPVDVAEVHEISVARVEQDWLALFLEEIQPDLAGLSESGVH